MNTIVSALIAGVFALLGAWLSNRSYWSSSEKREVATTRLVLMNTARLILNDPTADSQDIHNWLEGYESYCNLCKRVKKPNHQMETLYNKIMQLDKEILDDRVD